MNWKEFCTSYLQFTRKDRIGVLLLIIVLLLVSFSPLLYKNLQWVSFTNTDTTWIAAIKKLEIKEQQETRAFVQNEQDPGYYEKPLPHSASAKPVLFPFDPNSLDAGGWRKLGLRERTVQTIGRYLSKGGRFRKVEDLQRVYGLHADEYERLRPYVRIEQPANERSDYSSSKTDGEPRPGYPERMRLSPFDINTADTSAFIALPGIGSKLAMRIISFREKLGGFYKIEQVGETFGLADSIFQKIKPYLLLTDPAVKKININTATIDELKSHPYIKYALANPIVAYRNEHGDYSEVTDIKRLAVITDDIYEKIAMYLKVR